MKNLSSSFFLYFLLTASFGFSQIKKLGDLSSHTFMNSRPIFEENSDDIWGYAMLYMSDIKSSYIGEFELVIIDKNLNKVGSTIYDDFIIHQTLIKSYPKIAYVNKKGEDLLLSIQIYDESILYSSTRFFSFFRNLDLKTFNISDSYVIFEDKKNYIDLKTLEKSNGLKQFGHFERFNKNNFIRYHFLMPIIFPESRPFKYTIYDRDFNKGFEYDLPSKMTNKDRISILAQTQNFVVVESDVHGRNKNQSSQIYEVFDRKTNKKIGDINYFKKAEVGFSIHAKEENDKLVIFEQAHLTSLKKFEAKTFIGFNKLTVDPSNTKDLKVEEFRITSVGDKIATNPKGGLSDAGKFVIIDYRVTSENDVILVGGFFVGDTFEQLSNIYIFEFDQNFNSKNVINLKEEYSTKKLQVNLFNKMNYSQYLYSQKVGEDHFVFFYFDNENRGKKVNFSADSHYSLHIFSYEKGKFDIQKIDMKTKDTELYPMIGKLGFVVFQEIGKEKSEIRLERLNF